LRFLRFLAAIDIIDDGAMRAIIDIPAFPMA
jgi:hypothetical protein